MAMSNTLYEEEQPTQRWVMASAWLAAGIAVVVIVAALAYPGIPRWLRVIVVLPLGFGLFSVCNFRRLRIRATTDGISFGFGVFRRSLRWRDIVRVSSRPYIFLRFLGWGIRLDWRGTVGFIARTSMGVQLETRHLKYFISTDHPGAICELVQRCIRTKQDTSQPGRG